MVGQTRLISKSSRLGLPSPGAPTWIRFEHQTLHSDTQHFSRQSVECCEGPVLHPRIPDIVPRSNASGPTDHAFIVCAFTKRNVGFASGICVFQFFLPLFNRRNGLRGANLIPSHQAENGRIEYLFIAPISSFSVASWQAIQRGALASPSCLYRAHAS